MSFPYIAATAGWILTEMGRQPWIVQNLLKTSAAVSTGLSTATIAASLTVFVLLYTVLGVVDFVLMRHYARLDPPQVDQAGAGAATGRHAAALATEVTDMGLEEFWFGLIGVLWSGYFLLEGFDFGVGILLPVLPTRRARARPHVRVDRTGVGRQRGVAGGRRRRDVRRLPRLVRDAVLGVLRRAAADPRAADRPRGLVRVAREARRRRAGGRPGCGRTRSGASAPRSCGESRSRTSSQGVPLDSSHVFTGGIIDLFSAYTVAAGLAVVAMFALHGATYLTLADRRTTSASEPRARPGDSALPAIVLGGGVAAWTVLVAHQNNDRAILPTSVPAVLTAVMLVLALVLTRAGRTAGRSQPRASARSASSPPSSPASTRGCSSRIPASATA